MGTESPFRFFHLHGAVNQFRTREETVIQSPLVPDRIEEARTLTGEQVLSEAMIHPVEEKDILRFPHLHLYNELQRGLRTHNLWLFIGFSFSDRPLTSIIRRIFRVRRGNVKVLICNRTSAPMIRDRVFNNGRGVHPISGTFGTQEFLSALRQGLEA